MTQTKRPRTVQAKNTATFHNSDDLIEALRTRNSEVLKNSLVSFRNQITVAHDERVNVGDARLTLVTSWLDKSSGARELFDIWSSGSNYASLVLVTLAHTLSLLSSTPDTTGHAAVILRTLFDSTHAPRLNAHLAGGQTDVVLAALRVLNVAAAIDQRSTFEAVAWTAKALPKLLSQRHRSPTSRPLAHPSIRTGLTTLLLALLPLTLPLDLFSALFRGLAQDEGIMIKLILEACWEKVWCDIKVPKSLKVKVFGGLGAFIQPLYERTDPDSTNPLAPADIVHHFLLALCTNPGSGICFRSKGWYPRGSANLFEDSVQHPGEGGEVEETKAGTLYNPLLLKFLRLLRPSGDARQFELAVRILQACPDVVAPYFGKGAAHIGLSLEPRLSTRWINSVAFLNAVIGTQIPVDSFYVETSGHSTSGRVYRAEPPPLDAIVESVAPGVLARTWFTKALLSKSTSSAASQQGGGGLVQHTTIRLLTRCLLKLLAVLESFPPEWAARAAELTDTVRRRMPEVGVVVGIAQEAVKTLGDGAKGELQTRHEILAEGILRLLWLYALALPGAMGEVKFDVGKLLQETELDSKEGEDRNGMRVMCQIHVLRLLGESDQFVWSAKPSGATHTHMYRLLSLNIHTPYSQLRDASTTLIMRLLASGVLFEHDATEVGVWVDALPRVPEEAAPFLDFFDDVLSRCIKTPYRYLEAGNQLFGGPPDVARIPSLLLMATLEQLKHKPMEPSTRRTAASFVARLVRGMVGKMEMGSAKAITEYMRELFEKETVASGGTRVVQLLDSFLKALELESAGRMEIDSRPSPGFMEMVERLESVETASDEASDKQATRELMTWLRSFNGEIGTSEMTRVVKALAPRSEDTLPFREFLEEIDFSAHSAAALCLGNGTSATPLPFPLAFWIFLDQGSNSAPAKDILVKSLLRRHSSLRWCCGLVSHSLVAAVRASRKTAITDCLVALELVARQAVDTDEATGVKQLLFNDLEVVKSLMLEPGWTVYIENLTSHLLSSGDNMDCALVAPFSQYWSNCLLGAKERQLEHCATNLVIWIPFTPISTCVHVFKALLAAAEDQLAVPLHIGELLEKLASRLRTSTRDKASAIQLARTLPQLIKVHGHIERRSLLELASDIAERELPYGLVLSPIDAPGSLVDVTKQARIRWASKTGVLNSISWAGFSRWIDTPELVRFSTALMYLSSDARSTFSAWLGEQSALPIRAIGPCFALLDCHAASVRSELDQVHFSREVLDKILDCAARIFFKHGERTEYYTWAAETLKNAMLTLPEELDRIIRAVRKRFPANHREVVQKHIFTFFGWCMARAPRWEELLDLVVDSTLLWLVRRFAEDELDSPELLGAIASFESLLQHASNIKPHLVEPVLVAAIKNRFDAPSVMKLCSRLPSNVNKVLQSIVHHSSFTAICRTLSPARDAMVSLLHSLFFKHPSSTCHPSHIIPLLSVYHGTLDLSDTHILSVFQLFERSRQTSTLAILRYWIPEVMSPQPKDLLTTVCNFDPALVFRACTSFPQARDPGTMGLGKTERRDDIYDPNFVLPLLAALMVSDEPVTSAEWVDLCRTNVMSLAISSLSSKQPAMRQLGYASLATGYVRLLDVDFEERTQLIYILDLLRSQLPNPSAAPSEQIPRLPTYTTLVLAHAVRDIFVPATPLYPLISRFLLQRPEFDTTDVPMLYTLLYSSTGEWKRERGWMLRFLSDGMRSTEDWKVLKRRYTWDLLASLFQSVPDRALRLSILEVLANATSNKYAATSLLLRSSILSWIYIQLDSVLVGEPLAYLKIIENILMVVDHDQGEKATSGHWRNAVGQIIERIVQSHSSDLSIVYLCSRILFRLTISLPTIPHYFASVVRTTLQSVISQESALSISACGVVNPMERDLVHLHTSRDLLHPVLGTASDYWSSSIRILWRVVISMDCVDSDIWTPLNSRMLLFAGANTSSLEDVRWAREQVVEGLIAT